MSRKKKTKKKKNLKRAFQILGGYLGKYMGPCSGGRGRVPVEGIRCDGCLWCPDLRRICANNVVREDRGDSRGSRCRGDGFLIRTLARESGARCMPTGEPDALGFLTHDLWTPERGMRVGGWMVRMASTGPTGRILLMVSGSHQPTVSDGRSPPRPTHLLMGS